MTRFLGGVGTALWSGWSGRLRGEAVLVLQSRFVNLMVGAAFVVLTARHLGPVGRGEIAVAFALAWATSSLADLGTSVSGRIGLLRQDSRVSASDVISLTLVLVPLQAGLAVVAVTAVSFTSARMSVGLSVAVVLLSVAITVYNSVVSVVYGLRRYQTVLVADIVMAVVQVAVLSYLLVVNRLTSVSAVVAMAAGFLVAAAVLVVRSGASWRQSPSQLTAHWRELIASGLSPMAGAFASVVALRFNRLVLAAVVGSRSVGLFAVALTIPETLRNVAKAVGQVIADRGRSGVDSVDVARRHCQLFVFANCGVLIVGTTLGWLLLPTLFGAGFTEAREVLVVVTVAEVAMSVHLMGQAMLVGFGSPRGIGLPQIVGAVVTVLLNVAMVPRWGIQGAAWACLLGFSVLAVASSLWARYEIERATVLSHSDLR
jgi:O-antigen/teichoic acid export membrane protein